MIESKFWWDPSKLKEEEEEEEEEEENQDGENGKE